MIGFTTRHVDCHWLGLSVTVLCLGSLFLNLSSKHSSANSLADEVALEGRYLILQLLSKNFIDSDFCHNYLHTLNLFERL